MEIKIDERLVDVFNEVAEKDTKYFFWNNKFREIYKHSLSDFFCFIEKVNDNKFYRKKQVISY